MSWPAWCSGSGSAGFTASGMAFARGGAATFGSCLGRDFSGGRVTSVASAGSAAVAAASAAGMVSTRSEEHTSELQSLMRISYAVFCLKKKKQYNTRTLQTAKNQRHDN